MRLWFDHAENGLESRDGEPLSHFQIAGADRVFRPATATVEQHEGRWTLVVRSDLDMIVKSSRREFFVYVQDMVKQKPASGVEVLLALPDPAGGAPSLHVLETARDGVARLELSDLVERPELRVLVPLLVHAKPALEVEVQELPARVSPPPSEPGGPSRG